MLISEEVEEVTYGYEEELNIGAVVEEMAREVSLADAQVAD